MKKIILLFVLIFICIEGNAQWTQIKDNNSKRQYIEIYTNDKYVFMAVENTKSESQYSVYDVYVSENDGDNFTPTKLKNFALNEIFFNGDDVYASEIERGYYFYDNKELDWYLVHTYNYLTHTCKNIFIPDDLVDNEPPIILEMNDIIIYSAFNFGVFYSDDNGLNFKSTNLNASVISFFVNGNDLFACTFYGLYLSKDNGKTFSSVPIFSNKRVHKGIIDKDGIFVLTDDGVFFSNDKGINWSKKNLNNEFDETFSIKDIISFNDNILICTVNNVFLSKDNGDNWVEYSSGLKNPSITSYWGSFTKNNKYLFFANHSGVYRTNLK